MMQYKGYCGVIEVDEDAGLLHGRVLGLRDVITFQGTTVQEARQAFEESVDDYLEFCAEKNRTPEKPYSGKFLVRIDPALHREVATLAETEGMSLNAAVERALTGLVRPNKTDTPPESAPIKTRPTQTAPKSLSREAANLLADRFMQVAEMLEAQSAPRVVKTQRKVEPPKPTRTPKAKAR